MLKYNIYILLGILFIFGCSTKKNTWLSRNYHNLSAHYNVYFNGKESLKAGVKAIESENKDDYTQILDVFPDSKESSKDVASGEMDVAIKKGAKLVKLHSIRKKPKRKKDDHSVKYEKFYSKNEFNKWVDNAYLMMGKASFYKHDFSSAQQNFNYIFREFQLGPEWYEAEIYSIRVAIEREDLSRAKMLLESYNIEGKAPEGLNGIFNAAYADYYLRQEKYKEAVPFLEVAAKNSWSKYYKIRLNFILAQVYHKLNRYEDASVTYEKVIKFNPPYEMTFNAKVKRAEVIFGEGGLPAVQKEVSKLLRDVRNKEYQDQIYYALGKAYQIENQESEAIESYHKSIQKSVSNDFQKSLTYYELAKIYYEKPLYRPTYYYLDSALVGFTDDYKNINKVKELHEELSDLVVYMNNVEREDSLQRIANMSEADQIAFIEQLIQKEKDRQEELKRQEELNSEGDFFSDNSYNSGSGTNAGTWYFYNDNAMGMGKLEFEKRWGTRKLEDNWRRSNKEIVVEDLSELQDSGLPELGNGEAQDSSMVETDSEQKLEENNLFDPLTYLKDLPLTPEAMDKSNAIIEEGLISMGIIYKDELENIPYAIKAFQELIQRFPQSKYLEDALMNLYVCYEIQKDQIQMQAIRKQLETKFPDGEFTHFLNDPDFYVKREARKKKIETIYESAYADYLSSQFDSSIQKYKVVLDMDQESELIPKFKFIAGLSYAKSGDFTHFEEELSGLVKNYPKNEVTPVANEILLLYKQGRKPITGASKSRLKELREDELIAETGESRTGENKSSFVVDNNVTHSLILLYNKNADFNRLRYNIADYNFSKFLLNDYEMAQFRLPDGSPVFTVSGFKNRLEAMDYYYSIRERKELFQVEDLTTYQLFVVNNSNFKQLLSSGDLTGYEAFFETNYLSAEAFKKEEQKQIEEMQKESKTDNVSKQQEEVNSERNKNEEVFIETSDQQKKEIPAQPKQEPEIAEQTEKVNEVKIEEAQNAVVVEEKESAALQETVEKENIMAEENEEEKAIESNALSFEYKDGPHSAVVLFKKGRINIQQIGKIFTNYTKNVFGAGYNVDFGPLSTGYLYVKVSGFKNAAAAKNYVQKTSSDNYLMRDISRMKHYNWVITEGNFSLLSDEESFENYDQFYKDQY